ncbi:MAG: helix-turn-helix domain-containing protein [Smithella sp.]
MEPLLTEKEAAELLNVKPETLQTWRSNRTGPPFVKFKTGGIRYKEADLEVWAAVSTRNPNAEDKAYEDAKQREVDGE